MSNFNFKLFHIIVLTMVVLIFVATIVLIILFLTGVIDIPSYSYTVTYGMGNN